MARLTIVAEFDADKLKWVGETEGKDTVTLFNEYFSSYPEDAFEIALADGRFQVISSRVDEI